MQTPLVNTTVGQLVAERPSRALLFERIGLDYCCGGHQRLSDACARAGLDPDEVAREIDLSDACAAPVEEPDWSQETLSALVDHIVSTHHGYLREALPQLAGMLEKVIGAHGETHAELTEVGEQFGALHRELEAHMAKEEQVLFPICRALGGSGSSRSGCGLDPAYISGPIRVMVHEHAEAGDHLAAMRRLTRDFAPPADACRTYRALLAGLHELEQDLHRHIHKENNILFPRAAAAAQQMR